MTTHVVVGGATLAVVMNKAATSNTPVGLVKNAVAACPIGLSSAVTKCLLVLVDELE